MRNDFDVIPDSGDRRDRSGTTLARIYHDIALAAVAEVLDVLAADFDPVLNESLKRGALYLAPPADVTLSRAGRAA